MCSVRLVFGAFLYRLDIECKSNKDNVKPQIVVVVIVSVPSCTRKNVCKLQNQQILCIKIIETIFSLVNLNISLLYGGFTSRLHKEF